LIRSTLLAVLLALPALGASKSDQPPIYDKETDGVRAIEAGARFCAKSGRRLIINLGTNDCDTCRVVSGVLQEPKFHEALVDDFMPVYVDVTPGTKNAELLKRFNVNPKKGLPIIIIYDVEGRKSEITANGEMAKLAKKGPREVELWFLARFPKSKDR
jgi:thioredoxin-related protein